MHATHGKGGRASGGYSLAELLVVIAVLGILATFAIQNYGGGRRAAEGAAGRHDVAVLNAAVLAYNTANRELVRPRGSEMEIIALLQTRDPGLPGSPYLDADTAYSMSSSSDRVRAQWNSRFFELVMPGVDGSGIDLDSSR